MFNVLEYNATSSFTKSYSTHKPVIGIGRDGIINHCDDYVCRPEMFRPIAKSLEAVALMRSKGYKIVIVHNQPGISKGLFNPQDVDSVHQHMLKLLGEAGCPSIDAIYYSTSSLKEDDYAIPNTGMFKRCERENPHIDFSKGWYVGDCINDLKVAQKISSKPILVRTGKGAEAEANLNKFSYKELKKKTEIFNSLYDFANSLA
jgi:D-glycero-D-manno-heptose 1,7-bisphosphate phosphatase